MSLLQIARRTLRCHWRRYLALNLLIYGSVGVGAAMGELWPHCPWLPTEPMGRSALSGIAMGGRLAGALIWLVERWPLLGVLIAATNMLLVSLGILLGATWRPLLIPLVAFLIVVHVYVAMAHAATGTLPIILTFVLPEDQAIVLALFIALGLGTREGRWRERVMAWREYGPVYILIPVLLLLAGLCEVMVLHLFVSGRVL